MTKRITWTLLFGAILMMGLPCSLKAANHALLIGIGTYKYDEEISSLKGPKNDVARLKKVLFTQYGFSNIITLINEQATKKAILENIEKLGNDSRQGDKLLIYYSGHGTGQKDTSHTLPLPYDSGAILPWDCKTGDDFTMQEIMDSLIIGKRDLSDGILKQIDRTITKNDKNGEKRKILVVFDSCFSGMAVRAIGEGYASSNKRYANLTCKRGSALGNNEFGQDSYGENTIKIEDYPYDNIVFLAASGDHESARDIGRDELYKFPELNNKQHGAFTYGLLAALEGRINSAQNAQGQMTVQHFYHAIQETMEPHFRQTPNFLPQNQDKATWLANMVFFEKLPPAATASTDQPTDQPTNLPLGNIRVSVEPQYTEISTLLAQCQGIDLVKKHEDFSIVQDLNEPVMRSSNKHCIVRFGNSAPNIIAKRIKAYANVLPLIKFKYDKKAFSTKVSLSESSAKKVLLLGEEFQIKVRTEKKAWVVMLSIDSGGKVNILYPFYKDNFIALHPGRSIRMPENDLVEVVKPLGADIIKAFFYLKKPRGYEVIMDKEDILPGSPTYAALLSVLGLEYNLQGKLEAKPGSGGAQAQSTLRLSSYDKKDIICN